MTAIVCLSRLRRSLLTSLLVFGSVGLLTACSNRSAEPTKSPTTTPKTDVATAPTVSSPAPSAQGLTQLASFTPSPKEFIRVKPPVKKVALTFDAGSDDKGVDGILEQLKKHNVRATFFLTGQFCEKFPEAAKRIAEAGMEIGNHSYSHPDFTKLDNDKIREQLEKTDSIIQKTCGKSTKPLFRFPFGARDKRTCATVTEAGYQSIYWSVDSLDSIKPKKSADFLAERVIKRIQDGGISLMHVSTEEASPALERIFEYLDTQEIHVVTVSELLLISKDQQEKEAEHRLANAAKTKATQKPPLPAR